MLTDDGRTTDGRTTDAGVTGILIAHLGAFGSGELKSDRSNMVYTLYQVYPKYYDRYMPQQTVQTQTKSVIPSLADLNRS